MTALPIVVCDATATAPTAALAPIKNLRRDGLLSSIVAVLDLVLIACSYFVILDLRQV
jgi:hypothetical protein